MHLILSPRARPPRHVRCVSTGTWAPRPGALGAARLGLQQGVRAAPALSRASSTARRCAPGVRRSSRRASAALLRGRRACCSPGANLAPGAGRRPPLCLVRLVLHLQQRVRAPACPAVAMLRCGSARCNLSLAALRPSSAEPPARAARGAPSRCRAVTAASARRDRAFLAPRQLRRRGRPTLPAAPCAASLWAVPWGAGVSLSVCAGVIAAQGAATLVAKHCQTRLLSENAGAVIQLVLSVWRTTAAAVLVRLISCHCSRRLR